MEKTDLSSAYRRLKSPNIKTRKRALKIIKEHKRKRKLRNSLKEHTYEKIYSSPVSRLIANPFRRLRQNKHL